MSALRSISGRRQIGFLEKGQRRALILYASKGERFGLFEPDDKTTLDCGNDEGNTRA